MEMPGISNVHIRFARRCFEVVGKSEMDENYNMKTFVYYISKWSGAERFSPPTKKISASGIPPPTATTG